MNALQDIRVIRFDPVQVQVQVQVQIQVQVQVQAQAEVMDINAMYANPQDRPRDEPRHTTVGAGLLANASVESISAQLTQRLRQQAGSYRFPANAWILRWSFRPKA
jgi:hypothetical protein